MTNFPKIVYACPCCLKTNLLETNGFNVVEYQCVNCGLVFMLCKPGIEPPYKAVEVACKR